MAKISLCRKNTAIKWHKWLSSTFQTTFSVVIIIMRTFIFASMWWSTLTWQVGSVLSKPGFLILLSFLENLQNKNKMFIHKNSFLHHSVLNMMYFWKTWRVHLQKTMYSIYSFFYICLKYVFYVQSSECKSNLCLVVLIRYLQLFMYY